jgi:hypothetical protein
MPQAWTTQTLRDLDQKYAKEGIRPHARPLRAAIELLGSSFSIGAIANPQVTAIADAYRALFPHVDVIWPGMGVGLAVSVDQVRQVVLPVVYGTVALEPWHALAFDSKEAWWFWCREDATIAGEAALAVADLHDFAYGLNALSPPDAQAAELWHMATSNLGDVGTLLPTASSVDSVLQGICLTVELALKAASQHVLGHFKQIHDLSVLFKALAAARPHRDDGIIATAVGAFPPFVASRYKAGGLTRYEVARLALAAQFIAASTLRRLGPVDMALAMESDPWPGPRRPFL